MNNERPYRLQAPAVLALVATGLVAGCATDPAGTNRNSEFDWLSASATMRVEVEVYKGPLSKEPAVQLAELKGIVDDSKRAMEILVGNMDYSRLQMNCYRPGACNEEVPKFGKDCNPAECKNTTENVNMPSLCANRRGITDEITIPLSESENRIVHFEFAFRQGDPYSRNETQACNSLRQLFSDIAEGLRKYQSIVGALPSLDSEELDHSKFVQDCGFGVPRHKEEVNLNVCEDRLGRVSTYGSYLKRRAAYWAAEHVATSPISTRLRIEMANFAQFAAEYGNQITSRADALLKQASGARGIAILREQLPNSTYLRDSEPTAYLNLYDWNQAAVESGRETTPAERIRIVEHLVADNYWSHINTVFGAGQGDVSMALVKDDVGNWNLKSFDNSPGELLEAYKELGLAAVKTTVELASDQGGLSAAKNALNFADQIALGSTSAGRANETAQRLAAMRQDTARLIRDVGKVHKEREEELADEISRLTLELGQDIPPESGLRGKLKTAKTLLNTQIGVTKRLEGGIEERRERIGKLQEEVTSLTEQRDSAVSERAALPTEEDAEGSGAEGETASFGSQISRVAELSDKIGALNDQITSASRVLSVELQQQSLDLKRLEVERAKLSDLQQEVQVAEERLNASETNLQTAQIRKSDLRNGAAAQIQQLLDLHSAIIAKMAISAAEAAGPTAPTEGVLSFQGQEIPDPDGNGG